MTASPGDRRRALPPELSRLRWPCPPPARCHIEPAIAGPLPHRAGPTWGRPRSDLAGRENVCDARGDVDVGDGHPAAAAEVGRLQLPVLVEDVAAAPISMVRSRVRITAAALTARKHQPGTLSDTRPAKARPPKAGLAMGNV